jgi:formate hydrogenlyase subunit 6/NADH:ubiquinone oxidoreductase subunit I
MQLSWITRGLRTGIVTTSYPARPEEQPESWRGRPLLDPATCRAANGCLTCVDVCLPQALYAEPSATVDGRSPRRLILDYGRCIMCGLCVAACPAGALRMVPDYELAVTAADNLLVHVSWTEAWSGDDGHS